ncbi:tubulin-specific chaperone A-like protein [Leptotrombidium deliense]|uniref:Tubulin-specific chaperone A n=1 Tax=Leptotrombidium deliense TaxID=299467 RepID=A0A443SPD7_9ACAR|nr:tubulin-specific chaperone A-like protein [Leptotrombidium deliense]
MYEKEVETEKERLNKMITEAKDEYEIRNQEQVINESLMMLPDCQKRIYNAYNDLKSLLQVIVMFIKTSHLTFLRCTGNGGIFERQRRS